MAIHKGVKTYFITLFALALAAVPSISAASDCAHRIIFLPQTHHLDAGVTGKKTQALNAEFFEPVVTSQLNIARYLENYPGPAVFSELAVAEDQDIFSYPSDVQDELRDSAQATFPYALPTAYDTASKQQREILFQKGAAYVALIRGKINVVHRVVENEKKLDEIKNPIKQWARKNPNATSYPPDISDRVYGMREVEALEQINKYFAKHPNEKDVVLIFGANHNFGVHPEVFPPECIVVPEQFKSAWAGNPATQPAGSVKSAGAVK